MNSGQIMSSYTKILRPFQARNLLDRRIVFPGIAVLLGILLGVMVLFVPPLYLLFIAGGLLFAYLLLVKIEVAVILAVFVQNLFAQLNYLGGGTPFHPNGIIGMAIIVGAVFFFGVNKIEASRFREASLFLLFFLICAVSTLLVPKEYFAESLTVTIRLASALSIYLVLLFRLDSVRKVQWVLAAVVGTRLYQTTFRLFTRAGSTGVNFNLETTRLGNSGIGIYLAMILIICLVFFLNAKTTSQRLLWGALSTFYAIGLFFSFGRAGWIGFIIAIIVVGLLKQKWLLIITPLILVLGLLLVPGFVERFADISLLDINNGPNTFAGRVEIWQGALEIFSTHPITGVGFGVGRYDVGEYLHRYSYMIHNDYLSVLLETGLLGFILFILWHGQWLTSLLSIYRKSEHQFDQTMALAIFAMLIVSLVGRFTDNILLDAYDMYPISALVAAVIALPRIRAGQKTIIESLEGKI